ncbi:hypothetical protein BB561_000580 [Smittium simulii]|uniref:DM2 domain-containing protein n=1 Tax=Smittium simulii TaxID=133385 RepID=A0A2T9YYJ4_9FUNG|nr:hypothetical protein BB561_000580 [Smittium simulii]
MTSFNKRMRLSERLLPEKLSPYIPESEMYNNLIDLEKKVDYMTIQKRLQLQESLGKPISRRRILRIFLSNLAANQKHNNIDTIEQSDSQNSDLPSWTLKIEGKFIDMTSFNKRMRLSERLLPEKLSPYIPESEMYNNLIDLEKKVDYMTIQKRLQLQESLGKPISRRRILRIFLSNLAANQKHNNIDTIEQSDSQNSDLPSWTLKIEGKFIDVADPNFRSKPAPRKFSEQFNLILIELARPEHTPQENIIEWKQNPQAKHVDGFEIKRIGDKNVNVKISFFLKYPTQIFKIVNPALCELLNITEPISKVSLVSLVWHSIPELLLPFYAPVDPITLNYTIKVDSGEEYRLPYAFDIPVDVEEPLKSRLGILPSLQVKQKELAIIDEQQQKLRQAIFNSKTKCDFLRKFSNDPVLFLNRLVESMSRDLAVITGDQISSLRLAGTDSSLGENPDDSNVFDQPWAHEAVSYYLLNSDRKKESSDFLKSAIDTVSSIVSNTPQSKAHLAPETSHLKHTSSNPNLIPNLNTSQNLVIPQLTDPNFNGISSLNSTAYYRPEDQTHHAALSNAQTARPNSMSENSANPHFSKNGQTQNMPFNYN